MPYHVKSKDSPSYHYYGRPPFPLFSAGFRHQEQSTSFRFIATSSCFPSQSLSLSDDDDDDDEDDESESEDDPEELDEDEDEPDEDDDEEELDDDDDEEESESVPYPLRRSRLSCACWLASASCWAMRRLGASFSHCRSPSVRAPRPTEVQ